MAGLGKGGDLIDYTYLQKRGLIKKSEVKYEKVVRTKDGFVDLGSMKNEKTQAKEESFPLMGLGNSSTPSPATNSGNSGFVSLFDTPAFSQAGNDSSGSSTDNLSSSDLNALKIKFEDLEYKLSNLIDKISMVESKIDSFEKKVFN